MRGACEGAYCFVLLRGAVTFQIILYCYTQSQEKRNFSLWIFPGAQGQGNVLRRLIYSVWVYTLLQKKSTSKILRFF